MKKTIIILSLFISILSAQNQEKSPESLLLKDYRPVSIYKVPVSNITKAAFPVIDMHSHAYPASIEQVDQWVKTMDEKGIKKTIVLSKATGAKLDSLINVYSKYPDRFEVWCGFDYSNFDKPGYGRDAVAELERCVRMGARGIGELGDKGSGLVYSTPPAPGLHLDDPRLDPLLEKCGELGLPINIHVAEPIWMYQKMDSTNDGLMNAFSWRLDNKPGILNHDQMINVLENAVKRHPGTTFIACHFANLSYDLGRLETLLKKYDNLYADISARYAETATIPRFTKKFIENNQDKLLYGTDMGFEPLMYDITFRILESADEHFYYTENFGYHWAMNGFDLDEKVLEKLYRTNALKILQNRDKKLSAFLKE